ncbi:MAG TPA: helix-hairpin-helix domain-containing protein [Chthonomonadaceae bacterium]|nr:helix-hairpin-helix domain-containing protein [Chthonomonadaceae bacterium]
MRRQVALTPCPLSHAAGEGRAEAGSPPSLAGKGDGGLGKRGERGFILVEALVVIAGLVALMAILAANQRASLEDIQSRLRRRRAEAAVQSALARAVAVLQTANPNLVTLHDDWALLGDNGNQEFDLGDATFRLQIVDAGSLININQATAQQLSLLPITQEMIDCLLDWRETSLQPRPDGAKDDYYLNLQEPYHVKLGRLTTVSELLLIKNWTAKALYAPLSDSVSSAPLPEDAEGNPLPLASLITVDNGAPNTRANGQPRLNLGQRGVSPAALIRLGLTPNIAAQIVSRAPYPSFSALLSQPGLNGQTIRLLLDNVTVTNGNRVTGKLNLNTASQAVLQTVPNVTPDIAANIVSRQASGFNALSDLTTVPGVSGALLGQIANVAAIGSDTWIVRAYGESGGVGVAVEAEVTLSNGEVQIKTWDRVNTAGPPAWWDWQEEPTSTIDAGAG